MSVPRRGALAGALLLVNLPGVLAIGGGVWFYRSNRSDASIEVAGQRRGYVLHVPQHNASRHLPLVISLHGAGLWGAAQRDISRWNALADGEGFIVAYPSGSQGGRGSPRVWEVEGAGLDREVEFFIRLIDTLATKYGIDRSRVYVNGLSNGGGMTFALSCRMADRIAAVGLVAPALTMRALACPDARPLPVMVIHGTADPATPYEGGKNWIAPRAFPPVRPFVAAWAARNRCAPDAHDSSVAPKVLRREYLRCAEDADVVFYTLLGGGHVWPGGMLLPRWLVGREEDAGTIDATAALWTFFHARSRTVNESRR